MSSHSFEVVAQFEFVLLCGEFGFHFSISIVDNGQEHVQQYEEHEEHEGDEEYWSQHTICLLQFMEIEITQDCTQ